MEAQRTQVGFGKAVFATSSTTIAAFAVTDEFTRTFVSKLWPTLCSTNRYPTTDFPDISGFLFIDTVNAPEGGIICIQISVKKKGVRIRDGSLFIRVRAAGAAMLITGKIPHDGRCTLNSHDHVVFSGRGDILTLDDLEAAGVKPHKAYVTAFMSQEEIDECFTIQEVQPERSPTPRPEVHISDSGETVVLNVATPNRRIRVRR